MVGVRTKSMRLCILLLGLCAVLVATHEHGHAHAHSHGGGNPASKYSREANEAIDDAHTHAHSHGAVDEADESAEEEAPAEGGCGCGGHGHAHEDDEVDTHAHAHEHSHGESGHGHAHGGANPASKYSREANEAVEDHAHAHSHNNEVEIDDSHDSDAEDVPAEGGCGCGGHGHAHEDHESEETDDHSQGGCSHGHAHAHDSHGHAHEEHSHSHGDANPAGKYSREANEAVDSHGHDHGEHGLSHDGSETSHSHDHAHSHDHGHAHESHSENSHGHSHGEGGCGCGHSHGMDGSGTLLDDIVHEVTDMCPWLIIGLIVAVLLQVLPIIPADLSVYLGGRTSAGTFGFFDALFASVRGAVVGLCVPLCSCGVLPFAVLLAKQGCSPAVVTAFVTASQSAGLDSAVVTYGVLGPTATAARLTGAVCLAIAGGVAATSFAAKSVSSKSKDANISKSAAKDVATSKSAKKDAKTSHDDNEGDNHGHAHGEKASKTTDSNWVGDDPVDECCDTPADKCCDDDHETDISSKSLFYRAIIHPFRLLLSTFEEIVPWLGFGLVLSCVCTRYVREPAADAYQTITEKVGDHSPVVQEAVAVLMRGAVLAATIPLQLCEHATVTFTRALKQSGASDGLAFGFLSLTPSVNVATLGVLLKGFPASTAETSGMRVVRVCVALVTTAVLLSLAVDHFGIEVMPEADAAEEHLPAWLVDGSLMAAGALSAASLVRRVFF